MSAARCVLVHGHFYQPPRENPWLEAVQEEHSAAPYHDWNRRITDECYEPNTASRILNAAGEIERIVNNFGWMSFNVGPTLMAWLEQEAPEVYRGILAGDRESRARFGGHGSALAQAYNHVILPLASARDRATEIRWGIRDFQHRFGRAPEGMWLPEAAVDTPTLEALADEGIGFAVLAPSQAARCRPDGQDAWIDTAGGPVGIDPTRPYRIDLPSGRSLALFFYDGPTSQAVAFEGLLDDGARFAQRLLDAFDDREAPQLVHVATDGESYGHHHRWGDMALAYALSVIDQSGWATLANYGQYLAAHPPTWVVQIQEESSWSCAHGIERWRSDCGCSTGQQASWHQRWRAPLRAALDQLADTAAAAYEDGAAPLLKEPWAARDAYVDVILDRSPAVLGRFFDEYGRAGLTAAERVQARQLLEMARHALLMFTSCGWFFDDISGLEAVQVLRYAGRVLQLGKTALQQDWSGPFLDTLAQADSNLPDWGDGRQVFQRAVEPVRLDLVEVGAHATMLSLLEPVAAAAPQDTTQAYCYTVEWHERQEVRAARTKAVVARFSVRSDVTGASRELSGAAVHWGDHNVVAAVRPFQGVAAYRATADQVLEAFRRADAAAVIHVLDQHFMGATYNLTHLFRDEQRLVLGGVLADGIAEAEAAYGQVYDRQSTLMRFLAELGQPVPEVFRTAASFSLAHRLRGALNRQPWNAAHIRDLLVEAAFWQVDLSAHDWVYTLERTVGRWARELVDAPTQVARWRQLDADLALLADLPWVPDLRRLQNVCYRELVANEHGARELVGAATAEQLAGRVRVAWPAASTSASMSASG